MPLCIKVKYRLGVSRYDTDKAGFFPLDLRTIRSVRARKFGSGQREKTRAAEVGRVTNRTGDATSGASANEYRTDQRANAVDRRSRRLCGHVASLLAAVGVGACPVVVCR